MYTDMKIKTLMSIYRVSNITLARGVGADPSLVSRWRSGEREPSEEMLGDIASFLSGQQMLPHDRAALSQTVGADCKGREDTAEAILRWLCGKAVPAPEADPAAKPEPPNTGLAFQPEEPSPRPIEQKWTGRLPLTLRSPRVCADIQDALRVKLEMFKGPGLCVLRKNSISGFFLPPELIRSQYPGTGERQVAELLELRALFERHAGGDGWVEFLPATLYDAVTINGSCAVSGFELFETRGLTLSGDALRATLQVIRACLKRYPGFRIVWTEGPAPQNICVRGEDEALYVTENPFSGIHIHAAAEGAEAPVLPSASHGDRGAGLLDDMIETLNY